MGILKVGSRKITVDGVDYRWRVPRYKKLSDWKNGSNVLSEEYMKVAEYYGLGKVADIVLNIPIELYSNPKSKIELKYFGLCIDGFLGREQLIQIKPQLIVKVIDKALSDGWNPNLKGNYKLKLYENSSEKYKPAILLFPDETNDTIKNYVNVVTLVEVSLE